MAVRPAISSDFWTVSWPKREREEPLYNKGTKIQQAGRSQGPFSLWARPGRVELHPGDQATFRRVMLRMASSDAELARVSHRNLGPTRQGPVARVNCWGEPLWRARGNLKTAPTSSLEPQPVQGCPLDADWGLDTVLETCGSNMEGCPCPWLWRPVGLKRTFACRLSFF